MKTKFSTLVFKALLCLSVMGFTNVAMAQIADEPIITFKTNIYDSFGETNQFSLVIGSVSENQYVDIDCGFGKIEYEVQPAYMDSLNQMGGTLISCQVSKEGIVKIYGDPKQIDYFNASGCYISSIEFNNCNNLVILDLTHNELKGLDLSNLSNLQAIYVSDNTFSAESPLKIGKNKPNLTILEMNTIEHLDPEFNISDYPNLMSFDGYHNMGLKQIDPTGCPNLMRLTVDVTDIESVDVSKNPYLTILNVSNTKVTSLDLSKNPYLLELYCDHYGSYNYEHKISELDISNNTKLKYLFCAGNKLTNLDISKCPELITVAANNNYLTSFDVSKNPNLYIVEIHNNCLDFATLPLDPGTWNTYYYGQRDFPAEKSYKVGSTFDYSARVLREGTITDAALYSISEESGSGSPVDPSYYSYENGVMTINQIPEDSVYIAFANSMFPDAILKTEKFKIKSAEEFGDSINVASFSLGDVKNLSMGIGILGATPEKPIEFYVNIGYNPTQKFIATTSGVPSTPNVVYPVNGYETVKVYLKDGDELTAVDVKNIPMYAADVTPSASLQYLNIVNAGIYSIDLTWNRCLRTLNLSGNNLSTLSLAGSNGNYSKNALSEINLSNNMISDLTFNDMRAVRNINLANNQLSTLDLSFGDYVESIDISGNLFSEINLGYCVNLKSFKASNNKLSSIIMPSENVLEYFACDNNNFTLASLPFRGNIAEDSFIYAPQSDYEIATKGPCTDLSSQNSIGGNNTVYTWKKADGTILTEGVDYTITNGLTRFVNTEVGKIYCEMTNATFPAFTGENVYKTTPILAAGMPSNEIASFHTINEGDSVSLSLAAAKYGTAIYFDWTGDNNVTQYVLGDTYRIFNAVTKGDKEVKVYTYEPTEDITVFSMTGAKLSSFDGSKLTKAINVSVCNAGLSEIALPQSTAFKELYLEGNNFTKFDLGKYPYLTLVSLSNNKLSSIDFSKNANIQVASAAYNQLTDVKLNNNNNMWALYLDNNNLTGIDLAGAPNITQLSLSNNDLESINVDVLSKLRVLVINNNKLNFKTLPVNKPTYSVYYYHNQDNIDAVAVDGVVDLSDQLLVDTTKTVYRWFIDVPVLNDLGQLEGEELYIDTEYTLVNGVTTFLKSFENVMCVMTNAALPNVFICTNLMDVTAAGIENITTDNNSSTVAIKDRNIIVNASVENAQVDLVAINGAIINSTTIVDGKAVFSNVAPGVYVITINGEAHKVAVK